MIRLFALVTALVGVPFASAQSVDTIELAGTGCALEDRQQGGADGREAPFEYSSDSSIDVDLETFIYAADRPLRQIRKFCTFTLDLASQLGKRVVAIDFGYQAQNLGGTLKITSQEFGASEVWDNPSIKLSEAASDPGSLQNPFPLRVYVPNSHCLGEEPVLMKLAFKVQRATGGSRGGSWITFGDQVRLILDEDGCSDPEPTDPVVLESEQY